MVAIQSNKVNRNFRTDQPGGVKLDGGPYIGIIKNVLDPLHGSRLQVYIPNMGGVQASDDENNPSNWITVGYAPPFYGIIPQTTDVSSNGTPANSPQTYGFWMAPPDIGVRVLIVFVNGDSSQGYYFACIPEGVNHHMIPAIGSDTNFTTSQNESQLYAGATNLPTTEYDDHSANTRATANQLGIAKPVQSIIASQYVKQGTLTDLARGPITSSSTRETPSQVFGFSSPGRPIPDPADHQDVVAAATNNTSTSPNVNLGQITSRKGGHSFVLDDGDVNGKTNLIRLRTAGGHQITMSDSDKFINIAHSSGLVWLEMTESGQIDIFCENGYNVRAKGDINFHADNNINMFAGGCMHLYSTTETTLQSAETVGIKAKSVGLDSANSLNLHSDSSIIAQASGEIGLNASACLKMGGDKVYINSGSLPQAATVGGLTLSTFTDVGYENYMWGDMGSVETVVSRAPTHEPWPLHENIYGAVTNVPCGGTGTPSGVVMNGYINAAVGGDTGKPSNGSTDSQNTPVVLPVTSNLNCSQIPISTAQYNALAAVTTAIESGGSYTVVNSLGYAGRYQCGIELLATIGYVKPQYGDAGNSAMNNPDVWTGLNGINSLQDFLNSPAAQDDAFCKEMAFNYTVMAPHLPPNYTSNELCGFLAASGNTGCGGIIPYIQQYYATGSFPETDDKYGNKPYVYYNNMQATLAQLNNNTTTTGIG